MSSAPPCAAPPHMRCEPAASLSGPVSPAGEDDPHQRRLVCHFVENPEVAEQQPTVGAEPPRPVEPFGRGFDDNS